MNQTIVYSSTTHGHLLKSGVDAAFTIHDLEVHKACVSLELLDIYAGTCGAESLAAFHELSSSDVETLGFDSGLLYSYLHGTVEKLSGAYGGVT